VLVVIMTPVMYSDVSGYAPEWVDTVAWIGLGLVVVAALVLTAGAAGFALPGIAGAIAYGASVGTLIGAGGLGALGAISGAVYDGVNGNEFGTSIWTFSKAGFGIGAIAGAVIGGAYDGFSYTPSGLSKSAINTAVRNVTGNTNKMNHMMQAKHGLPNTVKGIGNLMRKTLINGTVTPYKTVSSVVWSVTNSQVTYIVIDGAIMISDMWIIGG